MSQKDQRIGIPAFYFRVAAVMTSVLLLSLLFWYLKSNDGGASETGTLTREQFKLALQAVSTAEEGDYQRSSHLWQELIVLLPKESDLYLNHAVTVLKWNQNVNDRISVGETSSPDGANLATELLELSGTTDQVVQKLGELNLGDRRFKLLEAGLIEAQTRQQKKVQKPSVSLEQAAIVLADALSLDPNQPLLACKLDEILQQLSSEDDVLAKRNADALFASFMGNPRNLYLLNRCGEILLRNRDPRILELIQPSLELSRPMLDVMRSVMAGLEPEEFLASVQAAVAKGDWKGAARMHLWLNVFKGTPGFQADAKLVRPDPMALLDTTFLNRYAQDPVSLGKSAETTLPDYEALDLAEGNIIAWYDADLDLIFDILVVNQDELSLFMQDESQAIVFALRERLQLPFAPSGILVSDLFEVDASLRPRVPKSVAELMKNGNPVDQRSTDGADTEINASRHDTIQEVLCWGEGGVIVVTQTADDSNRMQLQVVTQATGLEDVRQVVDVKVSDIEADGDLDLILATQSGFRIFQNNGNRTFKEITEYSDLPAANSPIRAVSICDFDRDLDPDILFVSANTSRMQVLENRLHGQFYYQEVQGTNWAELKNPLDLTFGDVDGNASWDWIFLDSAGVGVSRTSVQANRQLVCSRTQRYAAAMGQFLDLQDINSDGFLDLVVVADDSLKIFPGTTDGGFSTEPSSRSMLDGLISDLDFVDANGDGILDVVAVANGKTVVLLSKKPSEWPNNFLSIRVRGGNDANGGGRNNHYAVGSTIEAWSEGRMQCKTIQQPVVHFGFGKKTPDSVRLIFTNGLTQNYWMPEANMLIQERQELKGSCPFVYGWDGQKFQLITDLLWNAPLGLQVSRGKTLPDRRWEHLLLPGELVQLRDGAYELRITEELWEVAYFDHLSLVAVDHPESVAIFTNEKVGPPALAEPRLFSVQNRLYPNRASDSRGQRVEKQLAAIDRNYVQAFDYKFLQGLCQPHYVELDFGTLPTDTPVRLYLNGWLYPTDTSLNIAIDQNENLMPPEPVSLWVVDEKGDWICAQSFMGFPGGKPKSIVVDLADIFVSKDHRLRLGSSQEIYWDEAFVSWDSQDLDLHAQVLKIQSAELRYRGFSHLEARAPDQPHWYDYGVVSKTEKWPVLEGPFTALGSVLEQLNSDDDQMVVMTSGDEIRVRFSSLAPPPPGWRRDFVLSSVGWDKDADLNTLAGQGSLPLPFKNQKGYPAPVDQQNESEAVLLKNRSTLTRRPR